MSGRSVVRARRRAVEPDPLVEGLPDYADAFEVTLAPGDSRSAEDFARDSLTGAPAVVYWTIFVAHRFVLRFELAPRRSPAHVIGWDITHSEPDAVRLEADGPIVRAVIIGRRPDPSRSVATTSVFFKNRPVARALMPLVAPVHRAVAKLLLERAAGLPGAARAAERERPQPAKAGTALEGR